MLDYSLFQKFISRMEKTIDYNINIMDDMGVIVASKDKNRIGQLHEVAAQMIQTGIESGVVDNDDLYLNTHKGINMFIENEGKIIGVVGITGNPDEIKPFAKLIKSSIESMLEYEDAIDKKYYARNRKEGFLRSLIFEKYLNDEILKNQAKKLQIDLKIPRICIVLTDCYGKCKESVVSYIENYTNELWTIDSDDDLILFVEIRKPQNFPMYSFLKENIIDKINELENVCSEECSIDTVKYLVSNQTKDIHNYRNCYKNSKNLKRISLDKITFFNDNISNSIKEQIPKSTYESIFSEVKSEISKSKQDMLKETFVALENNQYNIKATAKELFLHRNTVIKRLDDIYSSFGYDLRDSIADREYVRELVYYLNKH